MRTGKLLGISILFAGLAFLASAQAQEGVPEHTKLAVEALASAQTVEILPGLSLTSARASDGVRLHVWRFSPRLFRLDVVQQEEPDGERVNLLGERAGAVLAVNGGFFGEREPGKGLFPVGLLRIGGKDRSKAWASEGGYLIPGDAETDIPALLPSRLRPPQGASTVLQSKPMLIEPGGVWAMNTNSHLPRPRTLVCALQGSETLIAVISGVGLSLFEAGWLLRAPEAGGLFGCDSALAMDGGGSTQMWVEGHPDLTVDGETPVQNALVLIPR
ncbi:MAG: phosphodiester glycosidase family protein [Rhizobiaceae bacterium]